MVERERVGYDIGWDFASFERALPDTADKANWDGYRAFHHGGRRHTQRGNIFQKKWLQIRFNAYRRQKRFSSRITPEYLRSILPVDRKCPVTRLALTFGELEPTDWSIERADNNQGYLPGNLIVLSVRANEAKGSFCLEELRDFASGKKSNDALTNEEWDRLVGLIRPMTPDESGRICGVPVLVGQQVAPGTPTSAVAHFQQTVGHYASLMMRRGYGETGRALLSVLGATMCHDNKSQLRAYKRLVHAVVKRACVVSTEDSIWKTTRVHKMLVEFVKSFEVAGNASGFVRAVDRSDKALQRLEKEVSAPGLADRSRYSNRSKRRDPELGAVAKA